MTMNRIKAALFGAVLSTGVLAGPASPALAETFPEAVPLIVDYQRLQTDSKASRDVGRQLQVVRDKFEKEIAKEQQALQAEQTKLRAAWEKLSPAEREKRQKAFEDKVAAAQRKAQASNKALTEALDSAGAKVREALVPIFSELMTSRGANVLLGTSEVLYFDPRLEITNEVLAQLDAKLPSIKVDVPPVQ
ncbi:OmpH family outer membrane protein [Oleomonas cavernae]|uniref:OmpH family outer membrane protein n=1 Tax=Oleomonas cavernae TaxID=2320859 RepID=A0A418WBU5_9PROT|nr:OmpH family outer membrane protein [Oleomonas cavernae]RJF87436.1 OmpH family outer membrane protein [Oleomonas cavernae]